MPPASDTQHEPEGDERDVEEGDLLQLEGVGDVLREVDAGDERERGRDDVRDAEGDADEDEGERPRHPLGNGAARDGAEALDGVHPVRRHVDDVVDGVDGACQEAERARRGEGPARDAEVERRAHGRLHEDVLVEEHGREDEEVLHPLVRTERLDEAAQSSWPPLAAAFGPPSGWARWGGLRGGPPGC